MADSTLYFPGDDGSDAALQAQVQAMYRAFPARTAAEAADCARAVLVGAARQPSSWRASMPRQRWWWGAAAAALLISVTTRPWRAGESSRRADSAFTDATRPDAAHPEALAGAVTQVNGGDAVRFDLTLPAGAKVVALVGDFNGWDERATPMLRRTSKGAWSAEVELPPGRHTYAFVVDGARWLVDPLAPQVPDAGFGPANAVVIDGTR